VNVVIVGNGGREHALAWRIARSPTLGRLVVTGSHPAWPERAELVPAPTSGGAEVARATKADLVVVGPEGPLSEGVADAVQAVGVPCFGPVAAAARLETSKAFTKQVLHEAHIPTAGAVVVTRGDPAARERCLRGNVVLKADGLAAGKGVVVCPTAEEALAALAEMDRFGAAADTLVLEDLLEGPEVSVFALCDGTRAVALPSAQDHKRLGDGDTGPNTGGMGAIVPCPLLDQAATDAIVRTVHQPVVDLLRARGTPFRGVLYAGLMLTEDGPLRGVLYAGLMLTEDGPRVLEFNVRFGDPECQPLMALWDEDVLPWLYGAASGQLPPGRPCFARAAACCVVLAAAGYPGTPERGVAVPEGPDPEGVLVFSGGTGRDDRGVLRTEGGGRVLWVTAVAPDAATARTRAYAGVRGRVFPGAQWRTDIGAVVRG
jgi:phosphoribosylamine---glycine ligase